MKPQRRAFLSLLARASGAGLLLTGGYAVLHRRPIRRGSEGLVLPDYRQGLESLDIAMSAADARLPDVGVRRAVEALGGMDRFVLPGDRVLIKPNVGFDRPPSFGATTSPEVVSAVVRLCREAGAREVWVTDNPINNPRRCFAVSGIGSAAEAAGATVLLPRASDFGSIVIQGEAIGSWEGLADLLGRADRLIGIPTVKDHNLAGISVTMKNWYGFLGTGRNTFHQKLDEVIADLAGAFAPTLVVVDGTRSLIRNGPTGGRASDVMATDQVAAGTDQVALDSWAAELMGRSSRAIKSIRLAERRGFGTSTWRSLNPVMT
ncbi:DUF362 domain-containing protein [Candidatus Fermentibacteria bacterium]|nr:DUF362 domain-containing protein [Candidatus Fermentibacteria bacterium]